MFLPSSMPPFLPPYSFMLSYEQPSVQWAKIEKKCDFESPKHLRGGVTFSLDLRVSILQINIQVQLGASISLRTNTNVLNRCRY